MEEEVWDEEDDEGNNVACPEELGVSQSISVYSHHEQYPIGESLTKEDN
jgi:hypothetical protein